EEAFAYRQGLFEARELRRLGVDVNFAPVLDVLTDRYSPNIGIRSYGKDPHIVTRYGIARIKGMQQGGVSACAKHFPGKGHSPLDACRSGALARREHEAAVERVRRLRARRPTRFEGGAPATEPDAGPLARAIATRAVTVVAPGRPDFRRALNGRVAVVFPRFSDLAPRITIEPEIAAETVYVADAFAPAGVVPETRLVGIEPTDDEIR